MSDEPTLSEILRRLDELSIEVKSIPLRIDETYVRRDVYSSDHVRFEQAMEHIIQRIEKMESRAEWTVRTVGALVISAIVSAVLVVTNTPLL